jgi:alpha-1,2-mannosyltransferase
LLNLLLWAWAAYLTRRIVRGYCPAGAGALLTFLLAIGLSAQFFLDNFHHVQVNGLILVLILLGIDAYLHRRDRTAAGYLVTATAIKLTPIFFLVWLAVRGRRRAVLAVPAVGFACIVAPLLARMPATGAADLSDYYHSFLGPQRRADLDEYAAGQNLAALVARMTRPSADDRVDQRSYRYLPLSERTARHAYEALWLAVLAAFLLKLGCLRRRAAPITALELSMVFLGGLLLSPITFTHHLVSLLFVFYAFLASGLAGLWPRHWIAAVLLFCTVGFIGLSGRDLVGSGVYLLVRGYSLIAWTMLLLFAVAIGAAPEDRGHLGR